MGRTRNNELSLFNELEKLNKKTDKLINENKMQTLTIYNLELTTKELKKEIEEKNKLIEKLIQENEKLKNKNNKNSSNSSKPSSSNYTTPRKKTGANLYNYRIKTNNKVGGQYGHNGNCLNKKQVEDLICNENLEVREIVHYINGPKTKKDIVKYKFDVEVKTYVEKHIFKHGKKYKLKLPPEFYTDVTYGNNIKSLSIHLGTYNVISYNRLSDFFSVITNNVLNISNGTLVNFLYEFSNKSESSINNLIEDITLSKTIYTDETGTKFNKKNIYVRNYSNESTVVYKANKKKGHIPIKEDDILTNFCGGIMADHDKTIYSYGSKNYECLIHLGRYLEEIIQNIKEISWASKMKELIFKINNTRKIAVRYGLKKFAKDKICEYQNEYDNIIQLAKDELINIKSTFYKSKAMTLYNRLIKYKENHLHILNDFSVPFDNNLSERDLRIFKTKTKVSGGFRSLIGIKHFVNALSIIKTSVKRNINPFDSIKNIFNNNILFA